MKSKYFFLLCCFIYSFYGCDKNVENNDNAASGPWSLINVSGGFAGIDEDFNEGVIVWTFDYQSNLLVVQNKNGSDAIYDGLASGSYPFSILENEKDNYLIVNNQEFGGITFGQNEVVIDQNKMSTGSGADMFILRLKK